MKVLLLALCLLTFYLSVVWGASWIVAAHDSSPSAKARADVICNGTHDQHALRQSLMQGPIVQTQYDDNAWTRAYSTQTVEWMAGTYVLSDTLILPQVVDTALFAEGTVITYKGDPSKDIIVLSGAMRSRFNFGTIWSSSNAAALAMKSRQYSNPFMPIGKNKNNNKNANTVNKNNKENENENKNKNKILCEPNKFNHVNRF